MSTISAISVKHLFSEPQTASPGKGKGECKKGTSTVANLASDAGSYLQTGGKGVLAFAEIACGLVCTTLGLTAEYFFKESWIDKASKLFSLGGLGITGLGFVNFIKLFRERKNAVPEAEPTGIRISNDLGKKCQEAENKIKIHDPGFFESNKCSLIRANNLSNSELTKDAGSLLIQYSAQELRNNLCVYIGKDPIIEGVLGTPKLSEFKTRFAELLTFCSNTYNSQDNSIKQVVDEILDDKIAEDYKILLPDDFVSLYEAIRLYAKEHKGNNDSIKDALGDNVKKELLKKLNINQTTIDANYTTGFKYLDELQSTHDFLLICKSAIVYVLDEQNWTPAKSAYTRLIQGALVSAFKLRGKSDTEIKDELNKILHGENKTLGIKQKLEALSKKLEELQSEVFSKPEFPFERKHYTKPHVPFLRNITFYEIEKKQVT